MNLNFSHFGISEFISIYRQAYYLIAVFAVFWALLFYRHVHHNHFIVIEFSIGYIYGFHFYYGNGPITVLIDCFFSNYYDLVFNKYYMRYTGVLIFFINTQAM